MNNQNTLDLFKKHNHIYLYKLILYLRSTNLINTKSSLYNQIFYGSTIISRSIQQIIKEQDQIKLMKNIKKLKFIQCFFYYSNDNDVCQMICDHI